MKKRIEVISTREVFKQAIFRIEEARLRFERHDGNMSGEVVRLNLDRGDSVAGVVHNITDNSLVFTEQFRYPAYQKGPGWIMEIPAGILDAGEEPEQAMRREILEEVGYPVSHIESIGRFYVSPGGTSERILLFYARVTSSERASSGGGVESEGEDIRSVSLPLSVAFEALRNGDIVDAKTIIGLQWLELNGERLVTGSWHGT